MSKNIIEAYVDLDEGGWHVCFHRLRDDAVSYWYGSREDCYRVAVERPLPSGQKFHRPGGRGKSSLERHETNSDCY